jgi:hypothetical protein
MYKTHLYAFTLIAGLTAGGLVASAQNYSREVKVPGVTRIISHDAVPDGFDPVAASDAQLEEYGFPSRPDPNDAKVYASWLRAVSVSRVRGEWMNTGRFHLPNQRKGTSVANAVDNISDEASGNWSGFAIEGGKAFKQVEGRWAVPSVGNQYGIGGNGYMSEWVGIDGDCNCNDLMQDGTAQQWTGGSAQYYGWVEYYPEPEVEVSSFPVSPGDVIQAYTEAIEKSGVVYASFYMANINTQKAVSGTLEIPSGAKFSGLSAEWIVERTEVNGSFTNPLPFYAYAYMDDAIAWRGSIKSSPSGPINFSKEANQNICMSSGTKCKASTNISTVSELGSDTMLFTWDHYD